MRVCGGGARFVAGRRAVSCWGAVFSKHSPSSRPERAAARQPSPRLDESERPSLCVGEIRIRAYRWELHSGHLGPATARSWSLAPVSATCPVSFFFSSPTHTAEILWASRKPLQGWKGSAAAGVGDSFYLGLPRPNSAPPTWASLLGAGLQAPRPPPPFQPLLLRGVWSLSFENSKWRLS